MGLPETGDIIVNVEGEPHIRTQFGAFPLSDINLMTNEERARYLPSVRTFTNILKKDNVAPDEINLLLEQTRDLVNNGDFRQFGGSGGFGGFGLLSGLFL